MDGTVLLKHFFAVCGDSVFLCYDENFTTSSAPCAFSQPIYCLGRNVATSSSACNQ